MKRFHYQIEASTKSKAAYILHVLKIHGLLYNWKIVVNKKIGKDTRIIVYEVEVTDEQPLDQIVGEIIFSTNNKTLEKKGLMVKNLDQLSPAQVGYIFDSIDQNGCSYAAPVSANFCKVFQPPVSWREECRLIGINQPGVVAASSETSQLCVIAFDIFGYLENAVFGDKNIDKPFEDWPEMYGTQLVNKQSSVDNIISLIVKKIIAACSLAMPVKVGYYPPNKTAPLIITGDSDEATQPQLISYFELLERSNCRGSILIKDQKKYQTDKLCQAITNGHCFGIHPFSADNSVRGYVSNFRSLVKQYSCLSDKIYCQRNHRFQWIDRTTHLKLAKEAKVLFDLNCASVSEKTWIGSGSGVGFPIAFPPLHCDFSFFPLHLPTVIEDDVFLYNYDYCYRPFKDGVVSAKDLTIYFLHNWVINQNYPATLNLHPEHIGPDKNTILIEILNWSIKNNCWRPTLREFGEWIIKRDSCMIEIQIDYSKMIIITSSTTPMVLVYNESVLNSSEQKVAVTREGINRFELKLSS